MGLLETIELTPRQRRFVEEYLLDLNATQAATRAGYSPETANEQGARLLANVSVAESIKAALLARGERVEVKADDVVLELKRVAFQDLRDMGTWDDRGRMKIKASSELTADQSRAIRKIRAITRTRREKDGSEHTTHELIVDLHDKVGAIGLLGKHLGMFPSNNGKGGPPSDQGNERPQIDIKRLNSEELELLRRLHAKMKGIGDGPRTIEATPSKTAEGVA